MLLLIFTDVDGTLIDFTTYEPGPALTALRACRAAGVPVIPNTSKSAVEIVRLRARLELVSPFAVENGAAVWIPEADPVAAAAAALAGEEGIAVDTRRGYLRMLPGTARSELVAALDEIAAELDLELRGLSLMNAAEVSACTALPPEAAEAAMLREFSEPFLILRRGRPVPESDRSGRLPRLEAAARRRGLVCLLGGRFFHLLGPHDKGTVTRLIITAYRRLLTGTGLELSSMALGDAPNDLAMLAAVDHPVLVRRHDGTHHPGIALEGLRRVDGIGPAGWAAAVLDRLGVLDLRRE